MGQSIKGKKNENYNSGITLIALVVTIIVLLILAGISINAINGSNGIINRAAEAKDKIEYEQIKEQAELIKLANYGKITENEELAKKISEADSFYGSSLLYNIVTTKDQKYNIIVDNLLNIIVEKRTNDFANNELVKIDQILNSNYFDITNNIEVLSKKTKLDEIDILSGEKIGEFTLTGDSSNENMEITLSVNPAYASNKDVLAIYKYENNDYHIYGYYEVWNNKFTLETTELGKYAIINKSQRRENSRRNYDTREKC